MKKGTIETIMAAYRKETHTEQTRSEIPLDPSPFSSVLMFYSSKSVVMKPNETKVFKVVKLSNLQTVICFRTDPADRAYRTEALTWHWANLYLRCPSLDDGLMSEGVL